MLVDASLIKDKLGSTFLPKNCLSFGFFWLISSFSDPLFYSSAVSYSNAFLALIKVSSVTSISSGTTF